MPARFLPALAFLAMLLLSPAAYAGLTGKVLGEAGFGEEVQTAGDLAYTAATAAAIGGSEVQSATPPFRPDGPAVPRPLRSRGAEAARGISGALGDLALNSGELTCSLWLIQLRSHLRNLTMEISRMIQLGEDEAEISRLSDLAQKTEHFASVLERECTKVGWSTSPPAEEWTLTGRIKNALGLGNGEAPQPTPEPTTPPAPPEIPEGWNVADLHCRNSCSGIYEAYANARAQSQNRQRDADNLASGELSQAQARERQAQANLNETRGRRVQNETHVRRDERQLQEAQAATQAAQSRVDALRAEAAQHAARAAELLQRLKECLKNCRRTIRDMSGEDATQVEGHFMNLLPDSDRRTYNTLPDAAAPRTQTPGGANKGATVPDKGKGVIKSGGQPVKKDGDKPQKEGKGQKTEKTPPPGFRWQGPYRAKCKPCAPIADELNAAKANADKAQADIARFESNLEFWEEKMQELEVSESDNPVTRDGKAVKSGYDRAQIEDSITLSQAGLDGAGEDLKKIIAAFNAALGRFRDCEAQRCQAEDGKKKAVKIPGGKYKIEVENVNKVGGTNPFNPKDVEDAGLNGNDGDAIAVTPPVVTQPPVTEPVRQPPVKEPTQEPVKEPIVVQPPAEPIDEPWEISVGGSFNFTHTVGGSPCPQAAGTVTVSSSNGHTISVSNISVGGSISGKLEVTASNGPNPSFTGRFNCSSPANGTFSGTVTATLTDTVTGDSKNITIGASGTVRD
ncbi:MAG: hypothetical protein J0L97_05385 [Alphaproteobacteria bacterium]|nr:hypothetical protein [Alphaproteobacteria bacterium]